MEPPLSPADCGSFHPTLPRCLWKTRKKAQSFSDITSSLTLSTATCTEWRQSWIGLTVQVWEDFVLCRGVLGCQVFNLLRWGQINSQRSIKKNPVLYYLLCVCNSAYWRCVVGKCLQVSNVGVDETTSAFDVSADVMVRTVGNTDSQSERKRERRRESESENQAPSITLPSFTNRGQHCNNSIFFCRMENKAQPSIPTFHCVTNHGPT